LLLYGYCGKNATTVPGHVANCATNSVDTIISHK